MYLRITHVQFDLARFDEADPIVQAANTALQQLPGYQRLDQGIDRTTGAGVIVTVWDTEAHARFSRDSLGDTIPRLQELGVQLEPPRIYELRS